MSYLYDPTSTTDWANERFDDLPFSTNYAGLGATSRFVVGNTVRVNGDDYGIVIDTNTRAGNMDTKNAAKSYLYNITKGEKLWESETYYTTGSGTKFPRKPAGLIYSNNKLYFNEPTGVQSYSFANDTTSTLHEWGTGSGASYTLGMCQDSSYIYMSSVDSVYTDMAVSAPYDRWTTYVDIYKVDPSNDSTTNVFTSDYLVQRTTDDGDEVDKSGLNGIATALCKDSTDYLYYVVYCGQKAAIYHVKTDGTSSAKTTDWVDTYWSGFPSLFPSTMNIAGSNNGHLFWYEHDLGDDYCYSFSNGSVAEKIVFPNNRRIRYGYYLTSSDPYKVLFYGKNGSLFYHEINESSSQISEVDSLAVGADLDPYYGGIVQNISAPGIDANLLPIYDGETGAGIRVPRVEIL